VPRKQAESIFRAARSREYPTLRRSTRHLGVAATTAALSLFAVTSPALAHANLVIGTSTCASLGGVTGYQVTWNIANDWNISERAVVTSTTGGVSTLSQASFVIPASGDGSGGTGQTPYESATIVQTLPSSVSGTIFLDVNGKYSDNFAISNTGEVALPTSCPPAPPTTTIPAPQAAVAAVAALTSPTTVPTPVLNSISPTATTVPSPVKHKAGHSATGLRRPIGHSATGLKRPTLLASVLPPSKPHAPITKAATFAG
jgi:hypothetical protein